MSKTAEVKPQAGEPATLTKEEREERAKKFFAERCGHELYEIEHSLALIEQSLSSIAKSMAPAESGIKIKSIVPALPGWKVKFEDQDELDGYFLKDVTLWAVVVDEYGYERATSFSSGTDDGFFDRPDDEESNFSGWHYLP